MKTAIISVGREVLTGKTVNTNLTNIAIELQKIGIEVSRSFVIDDVIEEYNRILSCVDEELLIFTGGLGPTVDDITRETVFDFYGIETYVDQGVLDTIKGYFDRLNLEMKDTNNKQALTPKGGTILINDQGTAPGVYFEVDGKKIVLLPGPPSENIPMLPQMLDVLHSNVKKPLFSRGFKLVGTGESHMESELQGFYEKFPTVNIAPYAGAGEIKYVFTSQNDEDIDQAMFAFYQKFERFIYSDLESTLEGTVVQMLQDEQLKISTAESCTGGLLAAKITDVSGSSAIFSESIITYSNEAKMKYLDVKEETLKEYGAVSKECVHEMVDGLKKQTGSDVCIAITGIAGPTGGTEKKPVGLVYFGLDYKGKHIVKQRVFNGDRAKVRQRAVIYALNMIRKELIQV